MVPSVPSAFPTVRGFCGKVAGEMPPAIVDRIPPGCHNNVRWLVGHCLVSTERLILGFAGRPMVSPAGWEAYFAINTSPSDFDAGTPAWDALLAALAKSGEALLGELAALDPAEELPQPFDVPRAGLHFTTRGEMVAMATWHEATHVGQMMTYRNILTGG